MSSNAYGGNRRFWTIIVFLLALLVLSGLALKATAVSPHPDHIETELRHLIAQEGLTPLTAVSPPPPTNPAQIELGQALFFENDLSGNRDINCATCHHPALALSDGLPLAVGTGGSGVGPERQLGEGRQFVPRNTPDLAHRGRPEWTVMFWDGRIEGTAQSGYSSPAGDYLPGVLDSALAVQAMMAVVSRHEMRGGLYSVAGYPIQPGQEPELYGEDERPLGWADRDIFGQENELAALGHDPQAMPQVWELLMARLLERSIYRERFAAAYPDTPLEQMDFSYAANALAAFQVDAFAYASTDWDRYLAGNMAAISTEAKQGAILFYGRLGCSQCHSGPLLTDLDYHNIGVPQFGPGTDGFAPLDYGRYAITNQPADRFAFRTPSLRNVTQTGPWLHNGAYDSLENVITHHLDPAGSLAAYNGRHLSPELRASLQNETVTQRQILDTLSPLLVEQQQITRREMEQLLAFLHSLSHNMDPP
jgi:cytochrome c peroxidase